jgi:hypothetical protein
MKKEHPCSGLYPYTAASYTKIGLGERHTGQPGRPRVSACLDGLVGLQARRACWDHRVLASTDTISQDYPMKSVSEERIFPF